MGTGPTPRSDQEDSLWSVLVGDGRPLLVVVAVALMFAGAFAVFLALRGEFLPHDEAYLGMTADELCHLADCRVVDFMLHDRVAFGGTLAALGVLYLWLVLFPISAGEAWAWWLAVATGTVGFSTFLTYLGYGYLDSWHGWGTLALVPFAVVGAVLTRRRVVAPGGVQSLWAVTHDTTLSGRRRRGWQLVHLVAGGLVIVGAVILTIGIDAIFVQKDIEFIGLTRAELDAANPRLVSLIAHDRAGFGGAIFVGGLLGTVGTFHARGTRPLWQAVLAAGVLAFGPAIAVHHAVGYTDPIHLAPAYTAPAVLALGLWLGRPGRVRTPRTRLPRPTRG